jgi:hypothetical protein
VGLKGRRDFVGRLQRLVDGPVPGSIVNHAASIPVACLASQQLDLRRRVSVKLPPEPRTANRVTRPAAPLVIPADRA